MKLCTDCKHYRMPEYCWRSVVQSVELVNGKKMVNGLRLCVEERGAFLGIFGCGKAGRFWEAKA